MPRLIQLQQNVTLSFEEEFTIGRSLECSHVIEDVTISRKHCKLTMNDNSKWFVHDLSANGMFVNDAKVRPKKDILLKNNDVIQIGTYQFRFKECTTDIAPVNNYDDAEVIVIDDSIVNVSNQMVSPLPLPAPPPPPPTVSTAAAASCSNSATANVDINEELTCSICMELFIKAVTVNCHHSFCETCITKWRSGNKNCPICRKPITTQHPSITIDNLVALMMSQASAEAQEARNRTIADRTAQLDRVAKDAADRTARRRRGRGAPGRGDASRVPRARARGRRANNGYSRRAQPEVINLEMETDTSDSDGFDDFLTNEDFDLLDQLISYGRY